MRRHWWTNPGSGPQQVVCGAVRVAVGLALVMGSGPLGVDLRAEEPELIPYNQDEPPGPARSAEDAAARMTVPDGFRVEVVAAEPQIVNPVAMTFDDRGRIWVTESLEYPRSEPGEGRDRVKILEDTDADGRVDREQIFAEGLNIPSGIAVGYGGVWVANAPDLLFYPDADGDDRPEAPQVVVSGFGRTDTHELPSSLTWGPDGWLYGLNGVFNHSVVRQGDREYRFTCALWRVHPRTRRFELYAEGTSNPWGLAWDAEGSAFVSACVIDHLWHLTETGYYHRQGGDYPPFTWKLGSIVRHTHQKAAYCGLHYFDSPAYPPEYRGRLYMGNIHGGCVNVDRLERRGSTYVARPEPDFLTAHDAWFMPVAQKTGPDGSLYVLDWYDRYHCYQDARRDPAGIERARGRLYRVRYGDTPRAGEFNLANETDAQLVTRLADENVYFRDAAQRLLAERATPETCAALERQVGDAAVPRRARLHGLWALIGRGPLREEFHRRLLAHADPTFRAWGVRAAGNQGKVAPPIAEAVQMLARDSAAEVRLQVVIAAGKLPQLDPLPLWCDVLEGSGRDPLLPQIVWQNMHRHLPTRGDEFVTRALAWNAGEVPALTEFLPRAVERMMAAGAAAPAERLVTLLAKGNAPAQGLAVRILERLADAVAGGLVPPELPGPGWSALWQDLTRPEQPAPLRLQAAVLAAHWHQTSSAEVLRVILSNPGEPRAARLRAVQGLVALADGQLLEAVAPLLERSAASPVDLRLNLLQALARTNEPRLADHLLAQFAHWEAELRPQVVELLTQRPAWSKSLLAAVAQGTVPREALGLHHARRMLAAGDEQLSAEVHRVWGAVRTDRNPDRERVVNEARRAIRQVPGQPVAGAEVFRRLCANCHRIYGEGQDVGPDLTQNGRNSFEQLLSNVLDPSLVVGSAYQARIVALTDGRVLSGLPVEESTERLVLKLPGGKLEAVPRADIEELEVSSLSLMPEGVETQMSRQELVDLFAFLVLDRPPADPQARRLADAPRPGFATEDEE